MLRSILILFDVDDVFVKERFSGIIRYAYLKRV